MKQLKKTLLTLVALLALTTHAWAQTGENIFQYCYDCQRSPAYPTALTSATLSGFVNPYVSYSANPGTQGSTSAGPWKLEYMGLWSTTDKYGIDDVSYYQSTYNCTDVPVFRLYQWNATANEYQHAAYGVVCCYAKVSNAVEHTALFEAGGHYGCVLTNTSHSSSMNITFDEDLTTGLTTLIAAATPNASGTPVPLTWDAATPNTATLTNGMPAGNVTVSVEYFPQATMADGAVTAATDVKATTEDALVTIDETKLTGVAKLMYFVSTDAEATAPAYTSEGWTDVLPTAANYTEAATLKVWYYAVGADNEDPDKTYSDGDICAAPLSVTLGAAPLWNAEFDLTDAPAEDQAPGVWKTDITGEGVKKGQTVTVTYSGDRKVIGVKAEKKAAPKLLEFEPGGKKFYYYEGETWKQAIDNHPENAANGWRIDEDDETVYNNNSELKGKDHDDEVYGDSSVDATINYIWYNH